MIINKILLRTRHATFYCVGNLTNTYQYGTILVIQALVCVYCCQRAEPCST